MHNLKTVVKFEILKQIRKPLFWLAVFAFPLMAVVFGGVSIVGADMAEKQGDIAKEDLKTNLTSVIVVDHSEIVDLKAFGELEVEPLENEEQAMTKFLSSENSKQALIIYPVDINDSSIKVYTKTGPDELATQQMSMGVGSLAQSALMVGASNKVDPTLASILSATSLPVDSQILNSDGKIYNPFQKMILPVIFLVIFFLVFILTGNQTLVATTEEKENRVAEMILTAIDAKTLISGKIIALVALGFIQISALIIPLLLLYFASTKLFAVSPFLSSLLAGAQFEFWPVVFGIVLLIFGFLLTTGFTILVGSLFPTAQDASQFYAPILLGMMLPLYFAGAIFSGAKTIVIQILSFFPLSAPMTLMMRNAAGNLPVSEGIIGVAVVVISSLLIMLLAVRAFRRGVFEYSKPTSLKDAISRTR